MAKHTPHAPDDKPLPDAIQAPADNDLQGLMKDAHDELARELSLPRLVDPAEAAANNARWAAVETARGFAHAILQNPLAERFLYGNPLDAARKCGEEPSVGAFLARRCAVLAQDFNAAIEEIGEQAYQAALAAAVAPRESGPDKAGPEA